MNKLLFALLISCCVFGQNHKGDYKGNLKFISFIQTIDPTCYSTTCAPAEFQALSANKVNFKIRYNSRKKYYYRLGSDGTTERLYKYKTRSFRSYTIDPIYDDGTNTIDYFFDTIITPSGRKLLVSLRLGTIVNSSQIVSQGTLIGTLKR